MKTVTIQIGNTDDKLTQIEWAVFVENMRSVVGWYCEKIHFFGASSNWEQWQNAAWIAAVPEGAIEMMRKEASQVGKNFRQDSVAWTEGETKFI